MQNSVDSVQNSLQLRHKSESKNATRQPAKKFQGRSVDRTHAQASLQQNSQGISLGNLMANIKVKN